MTYRILLVEDDAGARNSLAAVLAATGYEVLTAPHGERALELLARDTFDVVVTDIKMRRVSGLEVLSAARQQSGSPAVILLTGFGALDTAVAALRAGAADYLLKPCEPMVLLDCVAAAAERRARELRAASALAAIAGEISLMQSVCVPSSPAPEATPSEHFLQIGELCLNRFRHTASFRGKTLVLTATEYALLECLAETLGHVLGYVTIVRCTYGYTLEKAEARRLLKGHVHNLRQKIDPAYIVNVRGIGYLLLAPNQP